MDTASDASLSEPVDLELNQDCQGEMAKPQHSAKCCLTSLAEGASLSRRRRFRRRIKSPSLGGRRAEASLFLGGTFAALVCSCAGGLQMNAATSPVVTSPQSMLPGQDSGGGIGDMARSESHSTRFFRMIDRDGDGILEKPEVATFVRDSIGGSAFDTSDEVEAGVSQAMERLDRDHDDGLDRADVFAYWMQLESLLTADEVAEWVVYAAQLPESIGEIFKANVVTGYDFPELVDNDGEAISKELGIGKESFRKKILRHINARMLGIGTVPTVPSGVKHNLESCSTVSLSWTKATAKGFPVHSYRIQRRAVALHGSPSYPGSAEARISNNSKAASVQVDNDGVESSMDSKELMCGAVAYENRLSIPSFDDNYDQSGLCSDDGPASPATKSVSDGVIPTASPSYSASDWVTIYCGGENEFVDTGLKKGHNYIYRIQGWNSVGRSEWTTLDISRSLKKQGCTTVTANPHIDRNYQQTTGVWTLFNGLYVIVNFITSFIRAIFALTAVGAAAMRFKRANASSTTAANLDPIFPWLWRGINALSLRLLGMEVIPKSMLGDKQSQQYESKEHDRSVNAVGLNGYKSNRALSDGRKGRAADDTLYQRRVMFARRKLNTSGNLAGTHAGSTDTDTNAANGTDNAPDMIQDGAESSQPKNRRFFRSKSCEYEECGTCEPCAGTTRSLPTQISMRTLTTKDSSTVDEDYGNGSGLSPHFEDDHTRCNSCHKRYKFPKRFRHHCARCLSTFCHKHGKTTHSNLVSCRVPGDCVCNVCLELDAFNSTVRSERDSSRCREPK